MFFDYSSLLRPELAELEAYVPDLATYTIRLDANEAPPILDGTVRRRLGCAAICEWERYPDPTASELRHTIARRYRVSPEEVFVGVGSDEIIANLLTACNRSARKPPAVLTVSPTFVMYKMSAKVRGMNVVEVPLDPTWDLSLPALEQAIGLAEPALVFVASPNNPTGTMASPDRLERLIEAAKGALVVIDEAYVDYASRDQFDLYRRYPNVALMRTLSKIGFAALRVGWLVAHPELVRGLNKVRQPYNLNGVSQRLATLVLGELADEVADVVRRVVEERERVAAAIEAIDGFDVTPRQANFLWVRTKCPAGEVQSRLAQRGILVRSFHSRGGRLAYQLRITVGTEAQNDTLLRQLGEVS